MLQFTWRFRKGVAQVAKAVDADSAQCGKSVSMVLGAQLLNMDEANLQKNEQVIAMLEEGKEVLSRLKQAGQEWEGLPHARVSVNRRGQVWVNVSVYRNAKASAEEAFAAAL